MNSGTRIILAFFGAKVSALYLGPSGMALVGQVNNFMQLAVGAIGNGANTGVVTLTAERRHSSDALARLWGTAMRLALALAVSVAAATTILSPQLSSWLLLDGTYWPVLMCAAVGIVLAVVDSVLLGVLNGLGQIHLVARANIASSITEFAVFSSLAWRFGVKGGLVGITAVYATKLFVSATIAFRSRLIRPAALAAAFESGTAREIARYYPMLLSHSIAQPAALIFVRYAIIGGVGLHAAGHLQAAWRLSDMYVGVLTTALGLYFMAHFSSLQTDAERGAVLRGTMLQMGGLTAAAAIAIYLFRDLIIAVVLTKEFVPVRSILPLQLFGDVLKMFNYPLQMALVSQRRAGWYVAQALGFPALYVLLAHVLLSSLGVRAAPAAYAAGHALLSLALLCAQRKLLWIKAE